MCVCECAYACVCVSVQGVCVCMWVSVCMHVCKHTLISYIPYLLQIDDPYCSEVDESVLENMETCVGFELSGVPIEKIDSSKDK